MSHEEIWKKYKRPELIALQIAAKLKGRLIRFDDAISRRRWYFYTHTEIPYSFTIDSVVKSSSKKWGAYFEPA